ncbi:MAG: dUTP diphosphatase [Actinomycetota bacterium]
MEIKIKSLDKNLPLPCYAHNGDAGCDLYSRVDVEVKPGERALIPTGIAISIPDGYVGFVQPRSGLALKHGISIVNSPGTIDSKFRGEVGVILINLDPREVFRVSRGDKVAQLVVQKVENATLKLVDELDETERGSGGFGSTGK